MPEDGKQTFGKSEHLCSKKDIDRLFNGGGSRSMAVFPLRLVYLMGEEKQEPDEKAKVLISVPKRCFKRAVKRNRVKRQVREAYRKNKVKLKKDCIMAFIWLDDKLWETAEVEKRVTLLLQRLSEKP